MHIDFLIVLEAGSLTEIRAPAWSGSGELSLLSLYRVFYAVSSHGRER